MSNIRRKAERARVPLGVLLVLLFWASVGAAGTDGPTWRPVVTAFHVHSKVSESGETLDQLAVEAKASGIDAIIFSDNFLLHYEYGLFPLRGVLRRTVDLPSVLTIGVDRYLVEMREAGLRHPDVMLIPGVEVVPHYYWTGSIFRKDLTMHDAQKNVLVLGLPRADDYGRIPAAGNHASYEYGWNTVGLLWPLLLVPPAIWLINRRVERRLGTGWTFMVVRERRPAPGVALLTLAVLLLVNNYPFGTPPYDTYSDKNGLRPYQCLIDYVRQRGGVSIWSLPEAKDFSRHDYGRLGVVTVKTDPYPEALLQTSGYVGFGAVYEDTVTVTDPGGVWDAALMAYLEGHRGTPPWGFGEAAYHRKGVAGKRLQNVETVFWVKEKTPSALLDAMVKGRMYALVRTMEYGLRLDEFSLVSHGSVEAAISGETLQVDPAGAIRVRLSVTATDEQSRPVPVQIIRSGRVVALLNETTPFRIEYPDMSPAAGEIVYYRLLIGSQGNRIVSNPIFVRGQAAPPAIR
jgi:hypothetical protein